MPLDIIIVGAGIAGFATAITCRRAGHRVQIYERSSLSNEVGAAIHVAPNASRGLLALGLDPVRSRLGTTKKLLRASGRTMEIYQETDATSIEPIYGAPWYLAHRVDLHEELRRLATQSDGEGTPAVVHLKSPVVGYDPETGSIELSDGALVTGDLVIAADGVHTRAIEAICGAPNPALPTSEFVYRFLIPAEDLASDSETAHFNEGDDGRMKIYVGEDERLVWYPCRNNEIHNLGAMFHSKEAVLNEDWHTPVDKSALLERYSHFHPSLLAVFKKATEVTQWPLLFRAPIPSWHKGRLVLIGDAAHPMLPHQGQGGGQAIEDSVALGIVLTNCARETDIISQRLKIFEEIRMKRASAMQMFSNAGQDQAEKIRAEAAKYIGIENVPKGPEEFHKYNFGYDVVRDSVQAMKRGNPEWELPKNFFVKEPVRGVYP